MQHRHEWSGQAVRNRLAATTPRVTSKASNRSFFMRACYRPAPAAGRCATEETTRGARWLAAWTSDRQQVVGTGVRGWVTELGHGPSLDLSNSLTSQVEVLAHFLEGTRLTPVESESESKDLSLPLVER